MKVSKTGDFFLFKQIYDIYLNIPKKDRTIKQQLYYDHKPLIYRPKIWIFQIIIIYLYSAVATAVAYKSPFF